MKYQVGDVISAIDPFTSIKVFGYIRKIHINSYDMYDLEITFFDQIEYTERMAVPFFERYYKVISQVQ
jgi:hypothetical protein